MHACKIEVHFMIMLQHPPPPPLSQLIAELDYSAHQSEFSFLPSDEPQQTVCVDVLVVDDDILEDVETFYVDITTTVPRVAVLMSTATMSVVDDDSVVVTLVRSRLSVEEEMEGGEVEVCVHEIGVIEKEVEVQVFTEEDTAHGKACHQRMYINYIYIHFCIVCIYVSSLYR